MPDELTSATGRCVARAALAGNPSDGYGGAVLAVPVRSVGATVHVAPAESGVALHQVDDMGRAIVRARHLDGADDVFAAAAAAGPDTPHAVLIATLASWFDRQATPVPPVSVTVHTTIPRSVGLAGSSAIVIAAFRALAAASDQPLPRPDELARLALDVETERLGIAAGLQDRLVQAHGRPMSMRFDRPDRPDAFRPVEHAPLRWFVACRPDRSAPSQEVHGDLRRRFAAGEPGLLEAMDRLAHAATRATDALVAGDAAALGAAMDDTFDVRRTILSLDPAHVEMVDLARSVGAHANFAGSGGAVVVLARDASVESAARTALGGAGCVLVEMPDEP